MGLKIIISMLHDLRKARYFGYRTRDLHILETLLTRDDIERVFVINRPFTLHEMILTNKWGFSRIGNILEKSLNYRLYEAGKLIVFDYLSTEIFEPLLKGKKWFKDAFNKDEYKQTLKTFIEKYEFNDAILFLMTPYADCLINDYGRKLFVYDCDDNLLIHPEISNARKKIIHNSMINITESADIFFSNSSETASFYSSWCKKTKPIFISNGVNPEKFNKKLIPPKDLSSLKRPLIGYGGMLGKRINKQLIFKLTNKFKNINFVFIGPFINKKWIKPLLSINNFHYLGDKHYNEYPNYITNFDIAIIPHNVGEFENSGDPTKMYEYIAAGKPVITTNIAGVDKYKHCISIANNDDEFITSLKNKINEWENGKFDDNFISFQLSPADKWDFKVDLMISKIKNVLYNS